MDISTCEFHFNKFFLKLHAFCFFRIGSSFAIIIPRLLIPQHDDGQRLVESNRTINCGIVVT